MSAHHSRFAWPGRKGPASDVSLVGFLGEGLVLEVCLFLIGLVWYPRHTLRMGGCGCDVKGEQVDAGWVPSMVTSGRWGLSRNWSGRMEKWWFIAIQASFVQMMNNSNSG